MTALVLTNAFIYCHGYAFTGDANGVQLSTAVDAVDVTTFGSGGWKEFKPGLRSLKFSEKGFWSSAAAASGSVDTEAFPDLGVIDRVFTVGPAETATGAAYLFQGTKTAYKLLGVDPGQAAPFTLDAVNSDPVGVIRGQLAAAKQTVSATGALTPTTGVNLGAVSATQFLYGTFHVFPTPGTTITVVLESATSSAFSAPTTRATIGPLTTTGGTWIPRVAGAISDTWFRYRVSAITGTFTVAGAIAVQ